MKEDKQRLDLVFWGLNRGLTPRKVDQKANKSIKSQKKQKRKD